MKNPLVPVFRYILFMCLPLLLNSTTVYSYTDTGQILLYNKHFDKAALYYHRLILKKPLSVNAHRGYQDASFECNDSVREATRNYYQKLLTTDKDNPLYNYLYGRCLPCSEGMTNFDIALESSPCDVWALNAKGACYFEVGDLHNAKEAFLTAIKCKPDFGEAYQNLSQVYLQKGQQRRAKKVFRKLVSKDRKNAQSYEWLGDMYLNQNMYPYAVLGYQRSVKLGATGPAVFFKLGYALFKERKYLAAKNCYLKSIKAGNSTFEVFYNAGAVFELLDLPEEALEYYQLAFNKNGDPTTLYSMGNCAVQLGLYTKAIESYNDFLKSDPENTEALTGLANAYQLKKEYTSAIDIYKKIISIDNNHAKAYYNLGSIYAYYLKEYNNMELYWGKYIDLFPNDKDSRFIKKEMEKIANY